MNLNLSRGKTLKVNNVSAVLTVNQGILWLTKKGDLSDWILKPGQKILLKGKGWVIQAIEDAQGTWSLDTQGATETRRPGREIPGEMKLLSR